MDRLYANQGRTNFLCIVDYTSYDLFLSTDRLHGYLPMSTRRTSKRLLYREMAKVLFIDMVKGVLPYADFQRSSVSHGRNESVMLVNVDPSICAVGIDIEGIEEGKAPRSFIVDYLQRIGFLSEYDVCSNVLSTTIFSCMESIYKALCAVSICTFDINDYLLIEYHNGRCVFRYTGSIHKFKEAKLICRCYYMCNSVLTVILLDQCLNSVVMADLLYECVTVHIPG